MESEPVEKQDSQPQHIKPILIIAPLAAALIILAAILLLIIRQSKNDSDNSPTQIDGIAYLTPANEYTRTLVITDPKTGKTTPLVSAEGLEEYAISADGMLIAYTVFEEGGQGDIWLVDRRDKIPHPITDCVDSFCHAPAWNPDGSQIAYERTDRTESGRDSRVWIVSLSDLSTHLLFDDPQILGQAPSWSPDGSRIAVFDPSLPGIRVHEQGQDDVILPTLQDVSGHFSPDGTRLVYPVLTNGALGSEFYTHLLLYDFTSGTTTNLSGEDAPIDDGEASWSPDGTRLIVARRYLDSARFQRGKDLYLLDPASGDVQALVTDRGTNHAIPRWDKSGRRIIFQRFSLADPEAGPEIWLLDLDTGELSLVAENAFLPAWAEN